MIASATEITATFATIAAARRGKRRRLRACSIPSFSNISGSGTNSSRQLVQTRRTRRCAHVIRIELEIRNGSMPMSSRRVIAPAASFVCSVRKHLVTGQRRFHRDVGGFVVTNFTHHHDVRVLAQDGAQGRSEIEPDVVAHRNLIDAGELVLDRVLDRHDVVLRDCSAPAAPSRAWSFCRNRSGRSPGSFRAARRSPS